MFQLRKGVPHAEEESVCSLPVSCHASLHHATSSSMCSAGVVHAAGWRLDAVVMSTARLQATHGHCRVIRDIRKAPTVSILWFCQLSLCLASVRRLMRHTCFGDGATRFVAFTAILWPLCLAAEIQSLQYVEVSCLNFREVPFSLRVASPTIPKVFRGKSFQFQLTTSLYTKAGIGTRLKAGIVTPLLWGGIVLRDALSSMGYKMSRVVASAAKGQYAAYYHVLHVCYWQRRSHSARTTSVTASLWPHCMRNASSRKEANQDEACRTGKCAGALAFTAPYAILKFVAFSNGGGCCSCASASTKCWQLDVRRRERDSTTRMLVGSVFSFLRKRRRRPVSLLPATNFKRMAGA